MEPPILAARPAERSVLLAGAARRAAAVLDLAVAGQDDAEPYAAVHGEPSWL